MAAVRIKLTEEDRERLGAPEVITYDVERPRLSDVRELHRQCGLLWLEFAQKLDKNDLEAAGMFLWLAVRRAGVKVDWEEFDIDMTGFEVEAEEESPKNSSAPDGAKTN